MGYNTNYRLYCSDNEVLEKLVEDEGENEYLSYMDLSTNRGETYAEMSGKWYDHEDDMKKVSKENKGVLFTLHGEGEEGGDLWRKYFLNGKMQEAYARIEYDEFDSAKLK
jgi:hypothetical protein